MVTIADRVGVWAEAHGPALQGWALRLTRDGDLADDVVQGTFAVALERRDAAVPAASERAWLFGIAQRIACRALRARRDLLARLAGLAEPDPGDSADSRALAEERRALVAAAVA